MLYRKSFSINFTLNETSDFPVDLWQEIYNDHYIYIFFLTAHPCIPFLKKKCIGISELKIKRFNLSQCFTSDLFSLTITFLLFDNFLCFLNQYLKLYRIIISSVWVLITGEIHFKQQEFAYGTCVAFTKYRKRIQRFLKCGDLNYIYRNKLDKAYFFITPCMLIVKIYLRKLFQTTNCYKS